MRWDFVVIAVVQLGRRLVEKIEVVHKYICWIILWILYYAWFLSQYDVRTELFWPKVYFPFVFHSLKNNCFSLLLVPPCSFTSFFIDGFLQNGECNNEPTSEIESSSISVDIPESRRLLCTNQLYWECSSERSRWEIISVFYHNFIKSLVVHLHIYKVMFMMKLRIWSST